MFFGSLVLTGLLPTIGSLPVSGLLTYLGSLLTPGFLFLAGSLSSIGSLLACGSLASRRGGYLFCSWAPLGERSRFMDYSYLVARSY